VDQFPLTLDYQAQGRGDLGVDFPRITASAPSGNTFDIQTSIQSGEIAGLIQLRDQELPEIALSLSELAARTADELNRASNSATTAPPPNTLTGAQTGLLASDNAAFTGVSNIAVLNGDDTLARQVRLDFDNNQIVTTVSGNPPVVTTAALGPGLDVGGLTAAINTALGPDATATFANGSLELSATAPDAGVALLEDPNNPSDRGGRTLGQTFRLNDLIDSPFPAVFDTGLQGTDVTGFDGDLTFEIFADDGRSFGTQTITVAPGDTFNDVLNTLNAVTSPVSSAATFGLDPATGRFTITPNNPGSGIDVRLIDDTTLFGPGATRAITFDQLFGGSDGVRGARAGNFAVRADIAGNGDLLPLAQVDLNATDGVAVAVGVADGRGGIELQQALTRRTNFDAAGAFSAGVSSITEFSSRLAGDVGARSASATSISEGAASFRAEADFRRQSVEGVNVDEELANLIQFQQAFNASARLLQAAEELFDTLLAAV
ncbi:MAG: flagellar basal body rod C-terminal domain-containing protein, partial [Maricaulaceae bacterium]